MTCGACALLGILAGVTLAGFAILITDGLRAWRNGNGH